MREDGVIAGRGTARMPSLGPGESAEVGIEYGDVSTDEEGELHLTLSAQMTAPERRVPQGHEVAWDQFELRGAGPHVPVVPGGRIFLMEHDTTWEVNGDDFVATFEQSAGELTGLRYRGRELILAGPQPNFWRPPTDNDLGNGMHEWAAVWRDAGPGRRVMSVEATATDHETVRITTTCELSSVDGRLQLLTEVWPDGVIRVEQNLEVDGDDLPVIPRVGTQLRLPGTLKHVEWFGRGPHESYADRKTSAAVGRYEGRVDQQFHRYSRPQETGNKTDVRWIAVKGDDGIGRLVHPEYTIPAGDHHFSYWLVPFDTSKGDPGEIARHRW